MTNATMHNEFTIESYNCTWLCGKGPEILLYFSFPFLVPSWCVTNCKNSDNVFKAWSRTEFVRVISFQEKSNLLLKELML